MPETSARARTAYGRSTGAVRGKLLRPEAWLLSFPQASSGDRAHQGACRPSHDRSAGRTREAAPRAQGRPRTSARGGLGGPGRQGLRLHEAARRTARPQHRLPRVEEAPGRCGRTGWTAARRPAHAGDGAAARSPGPHGRRDHGLGTRGSGPDVRAVHARHHGPRAEARSGAVGQRTVG